MNKEDKIKAIETIIIRDGLDSPNRSQILTMKRRYLMSMLRSFGIPFHKIGEMFNRDHATAIHNIRQHHNSIDAKDKYYLTIIKECVDELESPPEAKYQRSLRNDILRCTSYNQIKSIKRRVLRGEYEELNVDEA